MKTKLNRNSLLSYFDFQVLASYKNQPDKYDFKNDFFEGNLSINSNYYKKGKKNKEDYIDLKFGFRTLNNGDLAVVVFNYELCKYENHLQKWAGFLLKSPKWAKGNDLRYKMWFDRYLNGSWDIENGLSYKITEQMNYINAMTTEFFKAKLFLYDLDNHIEYPYAQNTFAYQDSHKFLYGYIIDGLNSRLIDKIALKYKANIKNIKWNSKKLGIIFPELGNSTPYSIIFKLISENRSYSSHGVRKNCKRINAFEKFTSDLEICFNFLNDFRIILEKRLKVKAENVLARLNAKKNLPRLSKITQANYSINQAYFMKGKRIVKVKIGNRISKWNIHKSEVIILYFDDGSILSIDTGSNASNLEDTTIKSAKEFHVDMFLQWVHPIK